MAQHNFLAPLQRGLPLAIAHRGGAGLAQNARIENTPAAFAHAVKLGYRYLETDVHASSDGVLYAFHDQTLERLTGEATPIAALRSDDIDQLRLGGSEPIPRLRSLLDTFSGCLFSIDVKSDTAVEPMIELAAGYLDRICVASFSSIRLVRLRAALPGALTVFSPCEVAKLRLGRRSGTRAAGARAGAAVASVPLRRGAFRVVTPTFVRHAHELGVAVLVWTVDDPHVMAKLFDIGVDGVFTDRPDVLKDVLIQRGQWDGS